MLELGPSPATLLDIIVKGETTGVVTAPIGIVYCRNILISFVNRMRGMGVFSVDERAGMLTFSPHKGDLCSKVYLVGDTLIDLGNPKYAGEIHDLLVERGIYPKTIRRILLTHLHFDHVGDPSLFPRAKVYASRESLESFARNPEKEVWLSYSRDGSSEGRAGQAFIDCMKEGKVRISPLEEELPDVAYGDRNFRDVTSNGGGYFLMKGHSPGSVAFILPEGIFVGDCYGHRKAPTATPDCRKKRFIEFIRNYTQDVFKGHDDHGN